VGPDPQSKSHDKARNASPSSILKRKSKIESGLASKWCIVG
jgi:hypothetical protein